MINIKIVNKSDLELPKYETIGSAGMDIKANIEEQLVIQPFKRALIPTGLYIELPLKYEAQIRSRSGLSIKHGIAVVNGIGTIDSDYRGEIKVPLINLGEEDFLISKGDRIAQLVVSKYEKVNWITVNNINSTERNDNGFGSTGI